MSIKNGGSEECEVKQIINPEMKIGFDAKRAAQNRTGLGNYSRFVLRVLSQQQPECQYHLYIPNTTHTPYLREIPTLHHLHLHFPQSWIWQKLSSLWRIWGITGDIDNDHIDIYHGLSNELPLNIAKCSAKSIVTIHDLIFRHYPQYYNWPDRIIYNYKFKRACRKADHIIAVSNFTKQEIKHFYGIPDEKISVVYQGCDPSFAQRAGEEKQKEVTEKYRLPDKYLLYVGSIEERKNLLIVIKALCLLKENIKLVAVGKKTPYMHKLKRYIKYNGKTGMENDIMFLHDVPFEDLPAIYQLATTFVYPSRIEGFGIPLLEAISAGVPVIGCTGSCLEEAGGPGSIYVSPNDAMAMAQSIHETFHNNELRKTMIVTGKTYAKRFSDHLLCQDIVNIYNKVSER